MPALMQYVNRTSRCFTLYRNNQLEQEGLNGYQHLYIIKICKHPGILQDELVKEVYVNKSSVTRQLALLEQNGFIHRELYPQDRRQLQVYPTPKALEILPKVLEVLDDWNQRILEDFSEEEKAMLSVLMEQVMEKAMEVLKQQWEEEAQP